MNHLNNFWWCFVLCRPKPIFEQAAFHTTTLESRPEIEHSRTIRAFKRTKLTEFDGSFLLHRDAPPVAYVRLSHEPPEQVLVNAFPFSAAQGSEVTTCLVPLKTIFNPIAIRSSAANDDDVPFVFQCALTLSGGPIFNTNVHAHFLLVFPSMLQTAELSAEAFAERLGLLPPLNVMENPMLFIQGKVQCPVVILILNVPVCGQWFQNYQHNG